MPLTQPEKPASRHFMLIVSSACALAAKAHEVVEPDHLLLSIIYQNGPLWRAVISDLQIDPLALRLHVESSVDSHKQVRQVFTCGVLSNEATSTIGRAHAWGDQRGCASHLNVGTLLFALLDDADIAATLHTFGIDAATLKLHVHANLERVTDEL